MHKITTEWGIRGKLSIITTDNAPDLVAGVQKVLERMNISAGITYDHKQLYLRCVPHILNFAMTEMM